MPMDQADFRRLLTYDLVKLDTPRQLGTLARLLAPAMTAPGGADASEDIVLDLLRIGLENRRFT